MLQSEAFVTEYEWIEDRQSAEWRTIHAQLTGVARRRGELDAEEARLLLDAERVQIWRELGQVSLLDYRERERAHSPRVALDRLGVARALAELPELTEALERGQLPFSAIRELTRVATP